MNQVRRVLGMLGTARRMVESTIVTFIGWITRLLIVLGWLFIAMLAAGILYWLTARMMGWPMYVQVRLNTQDLMGIGIFVFCAAYAMKARG